MHFIYIRRKPSTGRTTPNPGYARIHNKHYANSKQLQNTINATTRHRADPFRNVINLATHSFTVYENKLLGYNSNFIPTPGRLNTDQLHKDISNFGRKLKLKAHFTNNLPMDKNDETTHFRPQPNNKWTPPNTHHTIKTFIESFENQVKEDISKFKSNKTNNLTRNEIKALTELQERDDIIIINADKGGAITILDTDDYIKEANRQLNNQQCYKKYF